MTIAVISAEAFEVAGLVEVLDDPAKTGLPLRFGCVGKWESNRVICAADGPGFRIAGNAVQRVIDEFSPDVIWSVGLCGALDEALEVGDVIVGNEVINPENGERLLARSPGLDRGKSVTVVSQDRVAATADEKKELRAFGEVVEMESAAVAREAVSRQIPFGCVKVVSDAAQEGFGIDLNRARDREGRFQTAGILVEAMRNPVHGVPELVRLFRRSRYAARRLGEFLVNCRI